MRESAPMCFGCGEDNPIGLKLVFRQEDDCYVADFFPKPEHQGYPGLIHGGITCALVDEAMGRFLWFQGIPALTAKMETRFKRPIPIGKAILVKARVISRVRGGIVLESSILLEDGQVAAEARGTYLIPRKDSTTQA